MIIRFRRFCSIVRTGLATITGAYAAGMMLYLILRLLFGDRYWWLALLNNFAVLTFLPIVVFLPLAMLLRARWTVALTLVLTAIGVLWFGPYYLPRPKATPSNPTLRVVTFNVWGHNSRLSDVEAWLRAINADTVVLQEIPEHYANNTVPALRDLYPYQISQRTTERWWGNALLSKYPIVTSERLPGNGVPAQQRFTFDINGRLIAVYNVHFAMPVGDPRFRLPANYILQTALGYNDSARNREITRLLARLKTETLPSIVAGDFNMTEQAAIYQDIAACMNDAFREAGIGLGGSWPVSVVEELPAFLPPLLRVDYIWHSAHLRAIDAQQGPKLGADHIPLYATLELMTQTTGRKLQCAP